MKLTRVLILRDQRCFVRIFFDDTWVTKFFGTPKRRLEPVVSEALRIGPVEAFGLTEKVEEADRLVQTSPEEASEAYGEVAAELRERFPGYANHFDLLRAKSLKDAGKADASHDALMELAIRNLVEQAEPQLFPEWHPYSGICTMMLMKLGRPAQRPYASSMIGVSDPMSSSTLLSVLIPLVPRMNTLRPLQCSSQRRPWLTVS